MSKFGELAIQSVFNSLVIVATSANNRGDWEDAMKALAIATDVIITHERLFDGLTEEKLPTFSILDDVFLADEEEDEDPS